MPRSYQQDETELPNDMKRPFGKHGEGTIFEREGIFDWDYKVGAFRTGLERDQDRAGQRQPCWLWCWKMVNICPQWTIEMGIMMMKQ